MLPAKARSRRLSMKVFVAFWVSFLHFWFVIAVGTDP